MNTALIAAVDIGGTKVAAMVAGPQGPLARVTEPTAKTSSIRALPEQCLALIEAACAQANVEPRSIASLGVASAGPFVTERALRGLATPNICGGQSQANDLPNDWEVIPLEQVLRERFQHVVIENDCVAALIAERSFGAVIGERDCVYATWSTGIGFGLCVDGHILRGKNGNAGHAGHLMVSEREEAVCGCGNRGDLEGLISGRNVGKRMNMPTADLFLAARAGDAEARATAIDAAHWFGRALYNLVVTLDTRRFVVGGSVWNHHSDWLEPIVLHEIESRLPALTRGVSVMPAALGSRVVDIGALCLVLPPDWGDLWRAASPWEGLRLR
jgi:glucokinase